MFFTEFGISDEGSSSKDQEQGEYYQKAFDYGKQMPYLETIQVFRLYTCSYAVAWGDVTEVNYGFMKEDNGSGLVPKVKAYALQKIFGGKGDLSKYQKK